MIAQGASGWPPELLAALRDHLPAAIADVVLRRAAAQARLGPEAWNSIILRRKLVEALCARAAVFLKGDQVTAFRQGLLEPSKAPPQVFAEQVVFSIASDEDVLEARQGTIGQAQRWAASGIARTRAATIVSELARNIIRYAQSGKITVSRNRGRVRIVAEDQGPGILDVESLLNGDGPGRAPAGARVRAGGCGGLGLQGSKRLADLFEIESAPGKGTRVTAELPLQ
jgi:serine/threonine-protein kinase RsbT